MFSAASVYLCVCGCLGMFVCQHDSFPKSKRRMMKLGVYVHCTKISTEFKFWGHRCAQNVEFGYDVGKISTGCLVYLFVNTITSERVSIGWWNSGSRRTVQKSRPSSNLGVIAPSGTYPPPKNVGVWLRRWENQCRLSS